MKYPQDVTALIGVHDLSNSIEVDSAAHKVWQVIVHEDWDWNSDEYDADISLVVLQSKVDLSDPMNVAIICLPSASDVDYEGTGTVVGWGISEASDDNREHFDSTPNGIELPSVTQTQCEETGNDFHTASSHRTFCAG